MKKKLFFLPLFFNFLTIFILTFEECKHSTTPGLGSDSSVKTYPLSVGNYWSYSGYSQNFNYRPVQPNRPFQGDTTKYFVSIKVEIIGERILHDSIKTWEFRHITIDFSHPEPDTFICFAYYRKIQDSLFLYAYKTVFPNKMELFPKLKKSYQSGHQRQYISSMLVPFWDFIEHSLANTLNPDSLEELSIPPKVLIFPLRVGLEWVTSPETDLTLLTLKKVIGSESISTPTGTFHTFKIRRDMYWGGSTIGDHFEFVSSNGLVRRTFLSKNFEIRDESGISGYIDFKTEYSLISFHVK